MSTTVFLVVLLAAALHAVWNALVRGGADRGAMLVGVVLGAGVIAGATLPFAAVPAQGSWPWIVGSVGLHLGYQLFLFRAYRTGELTHVYPIARGTAPLIVAVVSFVFGAKLGFANWLGVALIVAGVVSLGVARAGGAVRDPAATRAALLTGCFIAAYSLADGHGVRLAGTAVGFYGWEAVLNAVILLPLLAWRRDLAGAIWRHRWTALGGGAASYLAYVLVVWAFLHAPIASVSALRETSIVFALLIGTVWMKERIDLAKVMATFATLAGAIVLRLAR